MSPKRRPATWTLVIQVLQGGVQQAQTEAVSELDASMDPYEASFEADV